MKKVTVKLVAEPAMKLQHLRLECSMYPQTCDSYNNRPMAEMTLKEATERKPRLSGYCGFQIKDQNGCAVQEASLTFTPEEVAAIEAIAKKALQRVVKDTCGGV